MKKGLGNYRLLSIVFMILFLLSACATTQQKDMATVDQELAKLQEQQQALEKKERELDALKSELDQKEQDLSESAVSQRTGGSGDINSPLLPPNAEPGECYARVFVAPVYETTTETFLRTAESERIEVIPATYKMVEKEIIVSDASEKLVTLPAEYSTETESILVRDRELIWQTSLDENGAEASNALLDAARKHGIDQDAASPGDCFQEHYLPPVYETETENVLVSEESYRIEVDPARYEMVEEKVLVSEATTELSTIPATYKWSEEKVLVKEAHTTWKKGRGLIEMVDNTTGEIMCLVEEPAEYKTIRKKVVDQEARTVTREVPAVYKNVRIKKLVSSANERRIAIPAEYKTVSNKKMVQRGQYVWHEVHNTEHPKSTRTGNKICLVENPAEYRKVTKTVVSKPSSTITETIPAQYKKVMVKVVDTEAYERKIAVPAEYQTVTKERQISEGKLVWSEVLCETNTTGDVISQLQSVLSNKGYYSGPVDGVYGSGTGNAVKQYQQDNGLATGGLTIETIKHLGL